MEEKVGLIDGMHTTRARRGQSAAHARVFVRVHGRILLPCAIVCTRQHGLGLFANLGVTCRTPEQGCQSSAGPGGHVITQHFAR